MFYSLSCLFQPLFSTICKSFLLWWINLIHGAFVNFNLGNWLLSLFHIIRRPNEPYYFNCKIFWLVAAITQLFNHQLWGIVSLNIRYEFCFLWSGLSSSSLFMYTEGATWPWAKHHGVTQRYKSPDVWQAAFLGIFLPVLNFWVVL